MSISVLVQTRAGVVLATDSATYSVDTVWATGSQVSAQRVEKEPKLLPLSARLPIAVSFWGVLAVPGDPARNACAIMAKMRARFDGEADVPALEMGAYQLEDVARQVADAIAIALAPVFAGTETGTGGFVADHTAGYRFLVSQRGVVECRRVWPTGRSGIAVNLREGRNKELIHKVVPTLRGMTLNETGLTAAGLVAEQIVHAATHPMPRAAFHGPVDLVMLSADGSEWHTIPLRPEAVPAAGESSA